MVEVIIGGPIQVVMYAGKGCDINLCVEHIGKWHPLLSIIFVVVWFILLSVKALVYLTVELSISMKLAD